MAIRCILHLHLDVENQRRLAQAANALLPINRILGTLEALKLHVDRDAAPPGTRLVGVQAEMMLGSRYGDELLALDGDGALLMHRLLSEHVADPGASCDSAAVAGRLLATLARTGAGASPLRRAEFPLGQASASP